MSLHELFATWQAWNARDVAEQAARRAEAAGLDEQAAALRHGSGEGPRAIEALAAQHELAELLGSWRWHTVTAAREQGASWDEIALATGTDPDRAQQAYRDRVAVAEDAAAQLDVAYPDAERYRAAAEDDHYPDADEHHARHTRGTDTAADHADDTEDEPMASHDDLGRGHAPDDSQHPERGDAAGGGAADPGYGSWWSAARGEWVFPERDSTLLRHLARQADRDGHPELAAVHRREEEQLYRDYDRWATENPELHRELWGTGINLRGATPYQRESLLEARADPDGGYWQAVAEDRAERLEAQARRDTAERDDFPPPDDGVRVRPIDSPGWVRGPDAAHWSTDATASTESAAFDDNDHAVFDTRGPQVDAEGFLVGEITLPGGLPPEDDETGDGAHLDRPRWDEAWSIADRDGLVLFDPDVPGGFRALSAVERAELTDTVRASTPTAITHHASDELANVEPDTSAGRPERTDPRVTADGTPWVDSPAGTAERERWAVENADPAKALDDSDPDDRDALQQRLDELRMRLTGYTWREGVDRDQALAARRAQLGRWYDDDHTETDDHPDTDTDTDAGDGDFPGRGQCLIYPDDPEWSP